VAVWFFGIPIWKMPASITPQNNDPQGVRFLKESYNSIFGSAAFQIGKPVLEYAFGGSYFLFDRFVNKREFWNFHSDTYLSVRIGFPNGTDIDETNQAIKIFEKAAAKEDGVANIQTTVYDNFAFMEVRFTKEAENSVQPYIMEAKMTMVAVSVGNCDVSIRGEGPGFSKSGFGSSSGSKRGLEITGYNYRDLNDFADRIQMKLEQFPRVRNVKTNKIGNYYDKEDKFEQSIQLDRFALSSRGLNCMAVNAFLNPYINNFIFNQRLKISFDDVMYNVKAADFDEFQFFQLNKLKIRDQKGRYFLLNDISNVGIRPLEPLVLRKNQKYYKQITFEYLAPIQFQEKFVDDFLKTLDVPPGYNVKSIGQIWGFGSYTEENKDITKTLLIALVLMYIVLAGLYESFMYPLLIFMIIPLSLIGVFMIYYLTGTNFNQSAYIGVIFLFGIVVNNAIVLLDHINLLKKSKNYFYLKDLLVQAGKDRARPVLMTMITTVAGLLPMVITEHGNTKDIWYTLSLSTIGGLVSSTALGLIVLPVLVFLLEKIKFKWKSLTS